MADDSDGGDCLTAPATPFWRRKTLEQMSDDEWESLCDRCGRCCLIKLADEDSGEIHFTNVACHLLDNSQCRCRDYQRRYQRVADCLVLRPLTAALLAALPPSCAYRRLAEGRELEHWHPLISGDPDSVHQAEISVRGLAISEEYIHPAQLEDHIISFQ